MKGIQSAEVHVKAASILSRDKHHTVVNNPLGLIRLLFSASAGIYKSYRQVLTPIDNLQCLLRLPSVDKTRFVAFHKTTIQRNYTNWFLPDRENESAHYLDSLHAVMKTIIAKSLLQSDDAKL